MFQSGIANGAGFMLNFYDIGGRFAGLLFGLASSIGTLAVILASLSLDLFSSLSVWNIHIYLIFFFFLKNFNYFFFKNNNNNKKMNQMDWKILFLVSSLLYLVASITFLIWSNADTKSWAKHPNDDYTTNKESVEKEEMPLR